MVHLKMTYTFTKVDFLLSCKLSSDTKNKEMQRNFIKLT